MAIPKRAPAEKDIRSRIQSHLLRDRIQCSELVLRLLGESGAPYGSDVLAAARVLGRGVAGSGNMCGSVVAGVMALGVEAERRRGGHAEQQKPVLGAGAPAPRQDWLDTFTPQVTEPALFEQCRKLMDKVAVKAGIPMGSLNCAEISGVEWRAATATQITQYLGPEGSLQHCLRMVEATVETVREVLAEEDKK